MRTSNTYRGVNEPTINHINLPGPVERVAAKHDTRDYGKHLSSSDRATLNENNLYPFCF